MTTFSRFVRFGNGARFSRKVPKGKQIFDDIRRNLGGDGKNYDLSTDSLAGARLFATAMLIARVYYTQYRAGQQFRPLKARQLLPALEKEYGAIPEPDETVHQRQRNVAAYAKLPRGARYDNVVAVLTELLGADFIAYRPTPVADVVTYPTSNPDSAGVYVRTGTPRSVFRALTAVSFVGTPVTVTYTPLGGTLRKLLVGDRVIVDPGNLGRVEAVTVTAATSSTFTAVFTKPHHPGFAVATGRHPHHYTSKRENLVVLSAAGNKSGRVRARAHRALRRLLREVSVWCLAEETTPGSGTTGPFKVGEGKLGMTTIGEITL